MKKAIQLEYKRDTGTSHKAEIELYHDSSACEGMGGLTIKDESVAANYVTGDWIDFAKPEYVNWLEDKVESLQKELNEITSLV